MITPRHHGFSFLRSKMVFAVGAAVLVFVMMAIVDEIQRRRTVQEEIHGIESEVTRFEHQRTRLTDLLQQADQPEFIEREARLRLGLQKLGETVLVVPEEGTSGSHESSMDPHPSPRSNFRKWWSYVFHGDAS